MEHRLLQRYNPSISSYFRLQEWKQCLTQVQLILLRIKSYTFI
nr:MAG TPA: hypothetical protein [Caudoviricetes sp.]